MTTAAERIDGHVDMVSADDLTIRVRGTERAIAVGEIGEIARLRTHARTALP